MEIISIEDDITTTAAWFRRDWNAMGNVPGDRRKKTSSYYIIVSSRESRWTELIPSSDGVLYQQWFDLLFCGNCIVIDGRRK